MKYWKVLAQVEVGRKEHEISKTQKFWNLWKSHKNGYRRYRRIHLPVKENQHNFAPEYPKAGFGEIEKGFQTVEKVNKGQGCLENAT